MKKRPKITTGNAKSMALFGLSPNNHQLAIVTMITCEFPIRVAIPVPTQSIALWYDMKSNARTIPAMNASHFSSPTLLSSEVQITVRNHRNGNA